MLSQRAEAAALCSFAAKDFAGVLEARSPLAWDAVADVDNTAEVTPMQGWHLMPTLL